MKKVTFILLTGHFFLLAGDIFAQKINSGICCTERTEYVNIQYDYSNLMVGKMTEKDYIEKELPTGTRKKG